jgi:hypothetical protein
MAVSYAPKPVIFRLSRTRGCAARSRRFNKAWVIIHNVPNADDRLTDHPAVSSLLSSEFDRCWHAFWQGDLTRVPR